MSQFAQTILVATDFSTASELALSAAAVLARDTKARITIVHVHVPDGEESLVRDPKTGTLMAEEEVRKHLHSKLDEIAAKYFSEVEHVKVAVVVSRSTVEGICHYAERENVDLIAISTHGRTGFARMLIGSVAEQVVRHAPCPVLTLRSKVKQ